MRDADTPPHEPADRSNAGDEVALRQQAAVIRAAAADVRRRVQEWSNSPGWQDTPTNAYRYQATVVAVAALDALPEPATAQDLARLVDAVRPLLAEWRPSRPGPEQQIFIAVERLQKACA
ncbi:hypothetical protein [Micromonospora saelicesensis]|uniref:hypothetical protein n=1 Tax=Micromonospora saelicesensis TaxID=285676 RepID=UPI0011BECCC0|nr:hypothetical protein [Micromonospora saelicesensis]